MSVNMLIKIFGINEEYRKSLKFSQSIIKIWKPYPRDIILTKLIINLIIKKNLKLLFLLSLFTYQSNSAVIGRKYLYELLYSKIRKKVCLELINYVTFAKNQKKLRTK